MVNGLGRAPPDPIQWLPDVQAEGRENHPHQVVSYRTKEPHEMDLNHWINTSQINGGDAVSGEKADPKGVIRQNV